MHDWIALTPDPLLGGRRRRVRHRPRRRRDRRVPRHHAGRDGRRRPINCSPWTTPPTPRWPSSSCGGWSPTARGRRPDVTKVAVLHRLGRVAVGEPSVVIAVSTPHRADAFAACRFLIDAAQASTSRSGSRSGGTTAPGRGSTRVSHAILSLSHTKARRHEGDLEIIESWAAPDPLRVFVPSCETNAGCQPRPTRPQSPPATPTPRLPPNGRTAHHERAGIRRHRARGHGPQHRAQRGAERLPHRRVQPHVQQDRALPDRPGQGQERQGGQDGGGVLRPVGEAPPHPDHGQGRQAGRRWSSRP